MYTKKQIPDLGLKLLYSLQDMEYKMLSQIKMNKYQWDISNKILSQQKQMYLEGRVRSQMH